MSEKLLPVDDTVVIPKAVKAQSKRADELHAQYIKPPEPPKDPPKEAAPAPAEPPKDAPPKDVMSVPAPAPAEPPKEPAQPAVPAEGHNWEHAYKSMKGRFDRAEQVNQELRNQLGQMNAAIEELRRPPAAPAQEQRFERLVTDKELEDYGPDLITVMGKKAKEELNPIVTRMEARIKELESQLKNTSQAVTQSARERLFMELDQAVPQWRELDSNQDFINWLALPDRFSRATRHQLLQAAYEQNDAPRVAAFFQGFLSEAAVVPAAGGEPSPLAAPKAPAAPQVPLESLAAPGRAKATAAPAPVEKPIISRAQIAKFYADANRGKYADDEKARLERMIFEAEREGRIVN